MHANRGNGRQPRKKMYYYERLGHCICAYSRENYIEMSAKNSPRAMWGTTRRKIQSRSIVRGAAELESEMQKGEQVRVRKIERRESSTGRRHEKLDQNLKALRRAGKKAEIRTGAKRRAEEAIKTQGGERKTARWREEDRKKRARDKYEAT